MKKSTELLQKALEQNDNYAFWCRELGVNRTTLHTARLRGRLSPTVAGNLARLLGEDEGYWICVAAMEAEPETYAKQKLISREAQWRKWSPSRPPRPPKGMRARTRAKKQRGPR